MVETGLFLPTLLASCLAIGGVFSFCKMHAGVYSKSRPEFNGFMGGVNTFTEYVTRSLKDCDRKCAMSTACRSYTFDHATQKCCLLNFHLMDTVGLIARNEAVYFERIREMHEPFRCPSKYDTWNTVTNDGCTIDVRIVHIAKTHDDAVADCEADGGRLFLVNNLIKWNLFTNITNCPDYSGKYLVDGRNDKSINKSAADAYRTSYGEVVPLIVPLWRMAESSLDKYAPESEHCLLMHNDHFHTTDCNSPENYICERTP